MAFESDEFLESLKHRNPGRPLFKILKGQYTNFLSITFKGQTLTVPIGEILDFARRWERDFERKQRYMAECGGSSMYPYALMGTRLDDPDVEEIMATWLKTLGEIPRLRWLGENPTFDAEYERVGL